MNPPLGDLRFYDLAALHEAWREYDFGGPAPGYQGCVVRWKKEDGFEPVDF